MKKRYAILVAVFALVAGYGLALTPERERILEPGAVHSSVGEEEIRLLSYSSAAAIFTAQRPKAGAPFVAQATFTDGRPAQRCTVPPDLGGQLGEFARLVVKRGISLGELHKEFPTLHGVLDIRTELSPEFGGPYLIFTDKAQQSAVIVAYGSANVLSIPLTVFKRLEAGCVAFAGK
jgi:hypothetical protein